MTTLKTDPTKREVGLSQIRDKVVPGARALAGFVGGYWLISEDGTKAMAVTLFDSLDAIKASDAQASTLRHESSSASGSSIESVEVFEVVANT